jgi:hypothetical protein
MGVDRVLHDLEPVDRQHRVPDVPDTVHDVDVEARELRRRGRADVGPHEAPQRPGLAGLGPDLVLEHGGGGLRRLIEAPAVPVEQPPVIAAAKAVRLHDPVDERRGPVGTVLLDDAVAAVRRLPQGEVLSQQPDLLDRPLIQLADERHGVPVAAQEVAHRRTRADPGERPVHLLGQHRPRLLRPVPAAARREDERVPAPTPPTPLLQDRHRSVAAVHAEARAGLDVPGGERRAGDGWEPVLPAHDGGVRHRA